MESFPGVDLSGCITRVTVAPTFLRLLFLSSFLFSLSPFLFSSFLSTVCFWYLGTVCLCTHHCLGCFYPPGCRPLGETHVNHQHPCLFLVRGRPKVYLVQVLCGNRSFWIVPRPEVLPCGLQKPLNDPWNHHTLVSKWQLPRLTFTPEGDKIILLDSGLVFWSWKYVPLIGDLKVSLGHFGFRRLQNLGTSLDREQLTMGQYDILEPGHLGAGGTWGN